MEDLIRQNPNLITIIQVFENYLKKIKEKPSRLYRDQVPLKNVSSSTQMFYILYIKYCRNSH